MPSRIYTIYTQFDQKFMPGRISNSTGHEILVKLGVNSWIYTQFEQYFRPGRIGYHPNEFTPILSSISCPVEFEIRLVEFDRA